MRCGGTTKHGKCVWERNKEISPVDGITNDWRTARQMELKVRKCCTFQTASQLNVFLTHKINGKKHKKWRENRYSSTRYLVDWSAAHRTQYTSKRCLGAFTSPSNCSNAALSATLIDVRLRGGWPYCVVQWRSAGHGSYRRAQHR